MDLNRLRAHTNAQDGRVDALGTHLARVSELAGEFASHFGAAELGALLGSLHDVGKALPGFQDYLDRLEKGEKLQHGPPHAIWGAALWYCLDQRNPWPEVCLPIAGHHGGLRAGSDLWQQLTGFMKENLKDLEELRAAISSQRLLSKIKPSKSPFSGTRLELRIRLLLSALSDADFLATEEHFNPVMTGTRGKWRDLADLWPGFERSREISWKKQGSRGTLSRRSVPRSTAIALRPQSWSRVSSDLLCPRAAGRLAVVSPSPSATL